MRTYYIDSKKKMPMYEQLYLEIRSDIQNGTLVANERMPSKRTLAEHLKVSLVTVESAYAQLIAEGYLRSRARSGFFVETVGTRVGIKRSPNHMIEKPSLHLSEPTLRFDLKTNVIDPTLFPASTWSKLTREVLSAADPAFWNVVDSRGLVHLREAIALHLSRFRGMIVDPERIVIGTGTEYLLDLVVKLIGRNSHYAVENPGYPKIVRVLESTGVLAYGVSVDEAGLSVEDLRKTPADVVHVTPSHQFPKGVVMSIKRRLELLSWAEEDGSRYIIEDDYDSEFRFTGTPIPALEGLDQHGKVIYMNSFSKTLAPSLRIAYMVLPEALMKRFDTRFSFLTCPVPNLEQETLASFLQKGHFERHLNRMRSAYRGRRDQLIRRLETSRLAAVATWFGENAGLHFLLSIQNGMTEIELVAKAKHEGVRVYGLSEYALLQRLDEPPTLVVGYSNRTEAEIESIVQCLERAWVPLTIATNVIELM
jgi:GntR family transcriptional regulator / MocR family aminotransferase